MKKMEQINKREKIYIGWDSHKFLKFARTFYERKIFHGRGSNSKVFTKQAPKMK